MKSLLLLLVFSASSLPAEDMTGTWIFQTNMLGNRETVECAFQQKAAELAGSCKGEEFPPAPASGVVSNEGIRFSFNYVFAGQNFACTYTGRQTGKTEMTGSIVVTGIDGVSGEFKATKQEGKK